MEFEGQFEMKTGTKTLFAKLRKSEIPNKKADLITPPQNLASKFIGVEEADKSELFEHIGRYSEVPRKIPDQSMSSIGLSAI